MPNSGADAIVAPHLRFNFATLAFSMQADGGTREQAPGMRMKRHRSLAAPMLLLAGCALAAGGCVRTDDGTVTVPKELDMGRYWRRPPSPPQTPPVQSGSQVFPVPPASTAWRGSPRPAPRAVRNAAPARPLACRDEVRPGRRARVVCE